MYLVTRKLQEQSGTYYVAIPKIWVEAQGLKESDLLTVRFNGDVRIKPARNLESRRKNEHA
ncbi:MAG: AbrB/MazE/SpoVT family DNA-binding domain-containing protein [Candidatus Bathyarchaeia archaeon]|jgi:antitoxin component of MazEF toxin-antitoxin module